MSSSTARSADAPRLVNAVIVGAGPACVTFLQMVGDRSLGRFPMRIVGVADIDPTAPGLAVAAEMEIRTMSDFHDLYGIPGAELIVELTGSWEVRDEIEATRPRSMKLIDHFGANLFWSLHQAEQAVIRQRTGLKERVEREREVIAQIYNCIPDEVVVLDLDMVVQDANATFLSNNNLDISRVRGASCYELDQRIRGECRVAVEDCPFVSAVQNKRPHSVVRKHFDAEGNSRYAAIVAAPLLDSASEVVGVIEMTRDITSRIRLEEELRSTEVQLRQFMERAPMATYVKNRNLQYTAVNEVAVSLLGRPRSEVIGRTNHEILARPVAEMLKAYDDRVLRWKREVAFEEEYEISGKRVCLETVTYPVLDGDHQVQALCGLVNDVTEQREAEEELKTTREYLETILDNAPVMVVTTDLDGRIVRFNRAAEQTLQYSAAEVMGEHATMLYVDPAERAPIVARVDHQGALYEHETVLKRKDGTPVQIELTMSMLKDADGRHIGYSGLCRDITPRKWLMAQVIQAERMAAIGRLAAGVAHEINNPLAVISETMGFVADILDGYVPDVDPLIELEDALPKVEAQIKRARSITRRLLSFSRKTQEHVETADVNVAMDEVIPLLAKEAILAQVKIHQDYPDGLPLVAIEEVQLEEIFINLIRNAIQALRPHGGGNVWLEAELLEGKVCVTVRDDGPGIPEEIQPRLFDPFVTTKPPGQGTGLGLSICYAIAKRHDGEIRVESEAGKGATFHIILKIAPEGRVEHEL